MLLQHQASPCIVDRYRFQEDSAISDNPFWYNQAPNPAETHTIKPLATANRMNAPLATRNAQPDARISYKKRLRLWWNEYQWIAIGIAGVLFFILGYLGFTKFYAADPIKRTPFDLLHMTLQLFRIGTPLPPGPKPWELEAARTFATLLTTFAAVKALILLFREKFQSFRLSRWTDHVVICGLGEKGAQLATDLLGQGEQVAIIEKDDANSSIDSFREDGAIVLTGDAASPSLLKKARVAQARLVFVVGGDDQCNLEIALQVRQLIQEVHRLTHGASVPPSVGISQRGSEARPRPEGEISGCFVHLIDLELRELLQRNQMFAGQPNQVAIRCFNIYENAARRLFLDHPPEVAARTLGQEEVHLLIVGFGQMGRSVALQAARIGHYAHSRAIRITVVDRAATRKGASFTHKYPQFTTICPIAFVDLEIDEVGFLNGNFLEALGGQQSVTQVAVCLEQEAAGLICGLNLRQLFGAPARPLLIRMGVANDLIGRLQSEPSQGQPDGARSALHSFGSIADSCSSAIVIGEQQDRMARTVHAGYVQLKKDRGGTPATDASMASWDNLSDDLRESNRQQTEHLDIKLRTVGCRRRPLKEEEKADFAFTETEIELLAKVEHNRWNAERSLAGWVFGEEKSIPGKISPYIRPWAELSEEIKEYDRDTIRNIPAILAAIGEGVERV